MITTLVLTFCMWPFFILIEGQNNTITYNMAMQCKEYSCRHGYSYEKFYLLDSNERKFTTDPSIIFEMHLAILASSNGHILLSTTERPGARDPVYEIVVGGGGNKFSELRRNLKTNAKGSAKTVGVLSPIEFRAFYIKITEDGLIEFGREGEILPMISYMDNNPLPIKYFSFASWTGVEAKFLYDCPAPGSNQTNGPNSEAVESKESGSNNLMRTLLWYRDPSVPPESEVTVNVGLQVTSIQYDDLESILSVSVSLILKWTDNRLAWDPDKFNGTSHITLRQGQIWSPILFVFDDVSGAGPKNSEPVTILHSGESTLHVQFDMKSWCSYDVGTISKWPGDKYRCGIMFEPWEVHDKIYLNIMKNDSKDMKAFSDIQNVVFNSWDLDVETQILLPEHWNLVIPLQDNTTHQSDRIFVNMILTRLTPTYSIIFYTPLIVLFAFILMSFWTEPLKIERVWFYASCVLVICMGLSCIDYFVPSYFIPTILIIYVTVLGGVLLALMLHVFMMTSLADKMCETIIIQRILMSHFCTTLFCLPELKICRRYDAINEGYSVQEDEDANILSTNTNMEEMNQESNNLTEKIQMAEIVDKFLFVIYFLTFAVILAVY